MAFRTPQATFFVRTGIAPATTNRVVTIVKQVATEVPKLTGGELAAAPINIYLFADEAQFRGEAGRLVGKGVPAGAAALIAAANQDHPGLFLPVPDVKDPWDWTNTVMTNYLRGAVGAGPEQSNNTPQWLQYGTFEYLSRAMLLSDFTDDENAWLALRYQRFGGAYDQKRLVPLDQLVTAAGWLELELKNDETTGLIQAEATIAVERLANQQGITRVARVLHRAAGGAPWATAFEEVLGQTPAACQSRLFTDVPSYFPVVLPDHGPKNGVFFLVFRGFDPNETVAIRGAGPVGSSFGPEAVKAKDNGTVLYALSFGNSLGNLPGVWRVTAVGTASGNQALASVTME